jgi:hypothetical protein
MKSGPYECDNGYKRFIENRFIRKQTECLKKYNPCDTHCSHDILDLAKVDAGKMILLMSHSKYRITYRCCSFI